MLTSHVYVRSHACQQYVYSFVDLSQAQYLYWAFLLLLIPKIQWAFTET